MENKQTLADAVDEFFTSVKDLVDNAHEVVHQVLESVENPPTPTKEKWMCDCEQIWEEYFSGK